jgi:hypothetical protein
MGPHLPILADFFIRCRQATFRRANGQLRNSIASARAASSASSGESSVQPSSASASRDKQCVHAVGADRRGLHGWPPLPKMSRSSADVWIFASRLVTSASNRSVHVGYAFDGAQRLRHKGNIDES